LRQVALAYFMNNENEMSPKVTSLMMMIMTINNST
jgi:hypothetical protein